MSSRSLFRSTILALVLALPMVAAAQGPSYPYSVTLTWTDSTTSGTTGQNVYRANYASGACGAYTKITATPIAAAAINYTDTTVAPNSSYCYGVTALSGTSESAMSAPVTNLVVPPAPPSGLAGTVN